MNTQSRTNKIKLPFLRYAVDRTITAAYCLSTLYNVAFFSQMFLLAFISKEVKCSDKTFGYIETLFGLLQMAGGPLFGYIIQIYGARNALIVCYMSTIMSAIGLYSCTDVSSMVISRLPCLLMHGQQAHQSLLANLTKPGKQRTKAFGRLGLTFGLGFVFTPLLSKLSSVMGFEARAPLLTAVVICFVALAILYFFIPNKNQVVKQEELVKKETTIRTAANINISSLTGVLKRPNVLNLILQKNAAVAPALLIFSVLQLDLINRFSITSSGNSLLQIFIGVNIMMTNTVGISWIRSKFAEPVLVRLGLSAFIFTYAQFCWFHHLWQLAPMMMGMCFAMTLVGTVADSLLTSAVQFEQQGIVLGISTSMNSLVRTFSPALAGYLLQSYGIASIGFIGGLSTSAALLLHLRQPIIRISPASPPPTTQQEQGEHLLAFSQENKKGL